MRFTIPLVKALFIGPRGGKWANPQHTIPYQPERPVKQKRSAEKPAAKRPWVNHLKGMPLSTAEHYRQEDGAYSKERSALHKEIVQRFLKGKKPSPETAQKIAIVMMGGPASGKTTLVHGIMGEERFDSFVNIDPDAVKKRLPEWGLGLAGHAKDVAKVTHVESRGIAEEVYSRSLDAGLNLIIDGTGRDASKHIKKIRALQARGYHVTVMMADIDVGMAVKRIEVRAEVTGRYVEESIARETHRKIPSNFASISSAADAFSLFDSRGFPPVLKWSGPPDQIHDVRFVEKFKSRARRLRAQVKKSFHIMADSLKKAVAKKPPFMSVADLAAAIQSTPREVMLPDEKLPKKYSRKTGIIFDAEIMDDFEYHYRPPK